MGACQIVASIRQINAILTESFCRIIWFLQAIADADALAQSCKEERLAAAQSAMKATSSALEMAKTDRCAQLEVSVTVALIGCYGQHRRAVML